MSNQGCGIACCLGHRRRRRQPPPKPNTASRHVVADGPGPSGAGQPQLLRLVAAGITQLANRSQAECPVCLEHVPCMAGPCGHQVCEACAARPQVRQQ